MAPLKRSVFSSLLLQQQLGRIKHLHINLTCALTPPGVSPSDAHGRIVCVCVCEKGKTFATREIISLSLCGKNFLPPFNALSHPHPLRSTGALASARRSFIFRAPFKISHWITTLFFLAFWAFFVHSITVSCFFIFSNNFYLYLPQAILCH